MADPFVQRLAEGCRRLDLFLTGDQTTAMTAHAAELMRWNKKINLTAITGPGAVAEKHFVDAVAASAHITGVAKIMDLGSGGGFPGLPLKVLNPHLELVLVDAARKKVNFLKHVIRTLKLDTADAIHSRVEDLHADPDFAGQFDGIVARGFAGLEKFADLALPLLKPGGSLFAMKGENAEREITPDLSRRFDILTSYYRLPFEGADRYVIRLTLKNG